MAPCRKRVSFNSRSCPSHRLIDVQNLPVYMDSIVNDSSATLLSRAYEDPSTRFAVILGTGFNISVHLPVSSLAPAKYKGYPQKWLDEATHVLVNTECSMFGKGVFPTTRWDDQLNEAHMRPDFQPFEHMISGRYLGEIVRLIIVEAVKTAGLFGGEIPDQLDVAYTLDTGTIAGYGDGRLEKFDQRHCSFRIPSILLSRPLPITTFKSSVRFPN